MIKNRSLTERKIIKAVGETIKIHGYTGLGVNKIARLAGVNKNLIYRYFGTVEELVELYMLQKDYWLADNEEYNHSFSADAPLEVMVEAVISLLQRQFNYFYNESEMQHLILSEISYDNELLKKLSQTKESMAEPFFDATAKHFENSDINFRGVTALLNAGIYYLVLQSQKNDATNCGLNMRDEKDREIILKTVRQIVEWTFYSGKSN
jgi:AcrR family transcriptional regulator